MSTWRILKGGVSNKNHLWGLNFHIIIINMLHLRGISTYWKYCSSFLHSLIVLSHKVFRFLISFSLKIVKLKYNKYMIIQTIIILIKCLYLNTHYPAFSYKVIHIHFDLWEMHVTLVWKDQQSFYLHHFHIIILHILFVYVKFIASLLSYSIMYQPYDIKLHYITYKVVIS